MGRQPDPEDAVFPKSGYAFFRDRWGGPSDFDQTTYVALTAAYNSITHKHFDDLSFVAYTLGEWWLVDPGLYTYKRDDPFYAYARSFPAHNTIVVDGQTPELSTADVGKSRIDRWATGDALAYVQAHHTLIPGVTVRRGLYYLKPNVILVLDEIESERAHAVTLPLHFSADATVRSEGQGRWIVRSDKTGRTMRIEAVWPQLKARVVKGQTDPHVQGWVFPKYRQRLPAPVLELSTRGRSLRLLTVLELPSEQSSRLSPQELLQQRAADSPELRAVRDFWDGRSAG